jgi:DNA polymerase I-like protein with 3'-5' exonuclease and polymerase domains
MIHILSTNASNVNKVMGPVFKAHKTEYLIHHPENGIPMVEPKDVIMVLGKAGATLLADSGLVPKNRTPTSLRGKPVDSGHGFKILVTFDPFMASKEYKFKIDIEIDAALAVRLHNTGTIAPVIGTYRWVDNFDDVVHTILRKYKETGKPVDLATDLETVGLDEFNPEAFIVSIFFTVDGGMADGIRFTSVDDQPRQRTEGEEHDYWSALWHTLYTLLTSNKVSLRGANLKFDVRWIMHKWGIRPTNFKMDTTLVGSLLDENRSNSLNNHAKLYTVMGGYDDALNDKYDKGRMDLIPDSDLLPYAGGDTDATYRVCNRLKSDLLKQPRLANFYVKLLHPAARAFEVLETTGVLIDVDYYKNLRVEVQEHKDAVEAEALDMMPTRIKLKHEDKGWKLTRSAIIKDFMFSPAGLDLDPQMVSEKTQQPSTAKKHLLMFSDHPKAGPFIKKFEDYNRTSKTLSTYIDGFMKHLRSDNRLHPSYMLFRGAYGDADSGTVTGRLSAKDPAVQTIPKHTVWAKKLRRGYIAPPGYVYVEWDFSQGELRVCADVANEKNMIQAYNKGIDLHMITGGALNGYSEQDMYTMKASANPADKALYKQLRQGGKAGNFGLIYGMSALGYQTYAKDSYGVLRN